MLYKNANKIFIEVYCTWSPEAAEACIAGFAALFGEVCCFKMCCSKHIYEHQPQKMGVVTWFSMHLKVY
jgi:hypothetical protein